MACLPADLTVRRDVEFMSSGRLREPRGVVMAPHRLSYVKTLAMAASVGLSVFLITHFIAASRSGIVRVLVEVVGWSATLVLVCIVMGAVTVLYRDHLRAKARVDLFDAANDHRSERTLATGNPDFGIRLRRTCRRLLRGRWLLVGDIVTIRSLEEIRTTLDGSGCLDGLPFMTEMAGLSGHQALVFRRVDKIYDYGRTKKLRRLKGAVLLTGLRCDGSAHGGCQASCYLPESRLHPSRVDRSLLPSRGATARRAPAVIRASTPSSPRHRPRWRSGISGRTCGRSLRAM